MSIFEPLMSWCGAFWAVDELLWATWPRLSTFVFRVSIACLSKCKVHVLLMGINLHL